MNETPDPNAAGDSEWLVADEPAADVVASPPPSPARRTALAAVALVVAGALGGGVAVGVLRARTSTTATSQSASAAAQVPRGSGFDGPDQGAAGGAGGVAGEQRLAGTVTAVGVSSVTIRTAAGTRAYGVSAQTEIVRDGAVASLSAVRPNDSVFVHLIPGSGSSYLVERLFAQSGTGSTSDDGSTGAST